MQVNQQTWDLTTKSGDTTLKLDTHKMWSSTPRPGVSKYCSVPIWSPESWPNHQSTVHGFSWTVGWQFALQRKAAILWPTRRTQAHKHCRSRPWPIFSFLRLGCPKRRAVAVSSTRRRGKGNPEEQLQHLYDPSGLPCLLGGCRRCLYMSMVVYVLHIWKYLCISIHIILLYSNPKPGKGKSSC